MILDSYDMEMSEEVKSELRHAAQAIREHNRIHQTKEPQAVRITKYLDLAAALLEGLASGKVETVTHSYWVRSLHTKQIWYCFNCGERITYNPAPRTYQKNKPPVEVCNPRCRKCGACMDNHIEEEV